MALLKGDELEDETVEIELDPQYADLMYDDAGGFSPNDLYDSFQEFMQGNPPMPRRARKRVSVREARRILAQQEQDRLIDWDAVFESAVHRVENDGVVFIDEIDKTITADGEYSGEVSGAGVQRDLLPIVEGSVVMTRYGPVRTDHVLFIAAGSFHHVRPADLIPELQGRFPIRVELEPLGRDEFVRILTEPKGALIKQYTALMGTEGVTLEFTDDAIQRIAELAAIVNERTENIGARRLHTVMERLLDEVSFHAPELGEREIRIDGAYVDRMLEDIVKSDDLSRYIL